MKTVRVMTPKTNQPTTPRPQSKQVQTKKDVDSKLSAVTSKAVNARQDSPNSVTDASRIPTPADAGVPIAKPPAVEPRVALLSTEIKLTSRKQNLSDQELL